MAFKQPLQIIGLALLVSLSLAQAASAAMRVAIVKSSNLPPFEVASAAMTASLAKQPVQPEVLTFDLGGDSANAPAILLEVDAASPHLVVNVGTLATEMMVRAPGTVPVIFSMVLYPSQSGFLSAICHSFWLYCCIDVIVITVAVANVADTDATATIS